MNEQNKETVAATTASKEYCGKAWREEDNFCGFCGKALKTSDLEETLVKGYKFINGVAVRETE